MIKSIYILLVSVLSFIGFLNTDNEYVEGSNKLEIASEFECENCFISDNSITSSCIAIPMSNANQVTHRANNRLDNRNRKNYRNSTDNSINSLKNIDLHILNGGGYILSVIDFRFIDYFGKIFIKLGVLII